jgi:hypothetical protein
MPLVYTVEYSTDGTTWTELDNVQALSLFVGRRLLQDTYEPSQASFTIRYPDGYASPITALIVGTQVRVQRPAALYPIVWRGKIRNVTANYGIPYENYVGNADYLQIEAEGVLADWGRRQGGGHTVPTGNAYFQLADVAYASSLPIGTTFSPTTSPTLATSEVNDSYANWLNTFATSLGATVKDGSGQVGVYTKDFIGTLAVSFSDELNNSTHQVYDQIVFDSLAADYFTQVEVNTNTVGTVTANYGSAPYRTFRLDTFSYSTGQATDLANYYLGIYTPPSFGISEISCLAEAQNVPNLELDYGWWDLPGYRTFVRFRGEDYYMTILGASIDATPESSRYTYYLADTELYPYEVLDDPIYGQFDNRKLSW